MPLLVLVSTFILTCPAIFAHETKKFSRMNTSFSHSPNFGNIRSLETTTLGLSIKADSKVILSVVSADNDSTVTMNYIHTAGRNTSAVISAIAAMKAGNLNTISTTMTWKTTFEKTIFFARIGSVWRRSLSFSIQRWISRPISWKHIRTDSPKMHCETLAG